MAQQVLVIHGGEAFNNYDDFLEYLRTESLPSLDSDLEKRWRYSLADELGSDYQVLLPVMPNKQNAKYLEWKIWFERYLSLIDDTVILVGHSQGGYFLVKYLTENNVSIKIKALFLVAAVFSAEGLNGEDGGDFAFDSNSLPNLSQQTDKIFLYHSEDDPVVPFEQALKYQSFLPKARIVTFADRGHFLQADFPELVADIKALG